MKAKKNILILFLALVLIWVTYCIGYIAAFEAGEIRKADIAFSHAKMLSLAARRVREKNYDEAIKTLDDATEFYLFYVETTKTDIASLNLVSFIFRPNFVIESTIRDLSESFPEDKEIDDFKSNLESMGTESSEEK